LATRLEGPEEDVIDVSRLVIMIPVRDKKHPSDNFAAWFFFMMLV
jgi:hypothetical protein